MCKFFQVLSTSSRDIIKNVWYIHQSEDKTSIDGINIFSIGLFFFIVQLLEKSVTAKEEMELDLFGKVRFSYFMSH